MSLIFRAVFALTLAAALLDWLKRRRLTIEYVIAWNGKEFRTIDRVAIHRKHRSES